MTTLSSSLAKKQSEIQPNMATEYYWSFRERENEFSKSFLVVSQKSPELRRR
jgi:hypothetical protein